MTPEEGGADIYVDGERDRNRAMDGDIVYLEVFKREGEEEGDDEEEDDDGAAAAAAEDAVDSTAEIVKKLDLNDEGDDGGAAAADDADDDRATPPTPPKAKWTDDPTQNALWAPMYQTVRPAARTHLATASDSLAFSRSLVKEQLRGRVVYVDKSSSKPLTLVGFVVPWSIATMNRNQSNSKPPPSPPVDADGMSPAPLNDRLLLVPCSNKHPLFVVPSSVKQYSPGTLYTCEHEPSNSWGEGNRFPTLRSAPRRVGQALDIEGETLALLIENGVNHSLAFEPSTVRDVEEAVKDGMFKTKDGETNWKPTKEDLEGRRDFRKHCVFTIDPTTARDLDDALHIDVLKDSKTGKEYVELGVHIADVGHFIKVGTSCDREAADRATTIYLVDRVIPMLPRPLCEIACSLNENVDRLAFSCVWKMNMDGTMRTGPDGKTDVWYGKSVIRSCARLDYGTAQKCIDNECGTSRSKAEDPKVWDPARQPSDCPFSPFDVAEKVRLMNRVAVNRRKLRFENGAVALHRVKLVFKLPKDGSNVPDLCEPYPMKDSNRLVEEYMLLANYLVAERLITHGAGKGLLRSHPPPLEKGLSEVVKLAASAGVAIDASSSQRLQESLNAFSSSCAHDDMKLQAITSILTGPMQPAVYFGCGEVVEEEWSHFALNIPYYTHFTSPIRRFADVMVHRLLQATIEGPEAVARFGMSSAQVHGVADHCNEKKMGAKKAQERSDRVFLSLYLKSKPITGAFGIVISLGEKSFTVLLPSLGLEQRVFLDDHLDILTFTYDEKEDGDKVISIVPNQAYVVEKQLSWRLLHIKLFQKVSLSVLCKDKPPVDVVLRLEGPWAD